MRTVIAFAVICLLATALAGPVILTKEHQAKAKEYFESCVKQENVSAEDANRLHKKDFAHPSSSMKCFGACFFEKLGALKNNEVQEKAISQKVGAFIGEEKTKEILNKCKDVKGSDRCETGYNIYKCVESYKTQLIA